MHFVVAYDITSDRRRQKVLSQLKNYGLRVQYSVVECELDRGRLETLKHEVLKLIDKRTDRLHIFPLCENCYLRVESYGGGRPPTEDL